MESRLHYLISLFFLNPADVKQWEINRISELERKPVFQLATGSPGPFVNCPHPCFLCKAVHVCMTVLCEHTDIMTVCCAIFTPRLSFRVKHSEDESKGALTGEGGLCPISFSTKFNGYDIVPRGKHTSICCSTIEERHLSTEKREYSF